MNPVTYFKKYFTFGLIFRDEKTRDQVFYFYFFSFLFGLLSSISGITHLLNNDITASIIFLFILISIVLSGFIFPPQKNYAKSSIILLILIDLASIHSFWFTENVSYAWMFILLFPFIAVRLTGLQKGRVHSVILASFLL